MLEGSLPKCMLGIAIFGDRQATWHNGEACPGDYKPEHIIAWGTRGLTTIEDEDHPLGISRLLRGSSGFQVTNDPNEAKRLWTKAQEKIRHDPTSQD